MEDPGLGGPGPRPGGHDHGQPGGDEPEWAEVLARTVAHLAAQLTVAQLRLRALATELAVRGAVDERAVAGRVRDLALTDAGGYLRENLGEALAELIDLDALHGDLVAYLAAEAEGSAPSAQTGG